MATVGLGEGRRKDRDHRLGVGDLFQTFGLDRRGLRTVGVFDNRYLLAGKLRHPHLKVLVELGKSNRGRPAITGWSSRFA